VAFTAVVYVSNLDRMRTFYAGCFGLKVVEAKEDSVVLADEHWELALVRVPEEVAKQIQLTDPPARRESNPVKLGFVIDDITSLRSLVERLGGAVDEPSTEWDFRGTRRCDATDPEGNVIQLLRTAG
jgi:predicted enzyme related to lactoylglutathione lyase